MCVGGISAKVSMSVVKIDGVMFLEHRSLAGTGNPCVCSSDSVEMCVSTHVAQTSVYSPVSVQGASVL